MYSTVIDLFDLFREIYGLKTSDLVLQISPMTFDPSIVEIFTTLYAGATLLIPSDEVKMRPRELAAFAFQRHKVSVLQVRNRLICSFLFFPSLRFFGNVGVGIGQLALLYSPCITLTGFHRQ